MSKSSQNAWWNGFFSVVDLVILGFLFRGVWIHDFDTIAISFLFGILGFIFWFITLAGIE
jgi:hypothetical protein